MQDTRIGVPEVFTGDQGTSGTGLVENEKEEKKGVIIPEGEETPKV